MQICKVKLNDYYCSPVFCEEAVFDFVHGLITLKKVFIKAEDKRRNLSKKLVIRQSSIECLDEIYEDSEEYAWIKQEKVIKNV